MKRLVLAQPLAIGFLAVAMLAGEVVSAGPSATLPPSFGPADRDTEEAEVPSLVDLDPYERGLPAAVGSNLRVSFVEAEPMAARVAPDLDAATPTGLAAGDLDADGVPDLVCAFAAAGAGAGYLTVHRGNVDAVFPFTPAARERRMAGSFSDSPFFPADRIVDIPVRPDFVAVGDFDNDGYDDVLTASRGGEALYLLGGDGRGGLRAAAIHPVRGAITGVVAGEINRRDGTIDLAVAIVDDRGPHVLVYEGPDGALSHEPETLALPAPAGELALGQVVGDSAVDIVVVAGSKLVVIEGRDRRLTSGASRRAQAGSARVRQRSINPSVHAIAVGDFVRETGPHAEVALLGPNGHVIVLGPEPTQEQDGGLAWSVLAERGSGTDAAATRLLAARVSSGSTEGLFALDRGGLQMIPMFSSDATLAQRIPLDASPVAVLPMRLNEDAFYDLVALQEGPAITVLLSTIQATITVDSAADTAFANDGACTFREALANANANNDTTLGDCVAGSGNDSIAFNIAGGGSAATIALSSALPPVSDAVVINGNTQGCGSPPCIELAGGATAAADGLSLAGGNSTLRGFVINDFDLDGIPVVSGGNFIEGNFVGIDLSGTVAVPNGSDGIDVNTTSSSNTIGGNVAAARNVVSGNLSDGIEIAPGMSTQVLGNYVGTDVSGTLDLGNGSQGIVVGGTSDCVIGGATAGAGNLISGNAQSGVTFAVGASTNLVQGNRIGTDLTGSLPLGNDINGVLIRDSTGITIGGTAPGARNVIAANSGDGVQIDIDTGASNNNSILGNYIGTDLTGSTALGNVDDGIEIERATDNTVGGTTVSARNLISGNLRGVLLDDPGTSGNEILGNYVGTDVDGVAPLANLQYGVAAFDGAAGNMIGGADAGAGNLISGNGINGVRISEPSNGNRIQGNLIGTDRMGTTALPNILDGVQVNNIVTGTVIGGTLPGAGNLIAGNGQFGIALVNGPSLSQIQGNFVGTDVTGSLALPNALSGVFVLDSSSNTVGGTAAGARNLVSGNGENGVFLLGVLADSNQIQGNLIGTDVSGTMSLPNMLSGIELSDASNNTVGGTAAGARNLLSGNAGSGVYMHGVLGASNRIQGNRIGTDVSGTVSLPNMSSGIQVRDASDNTIGGTVAGAGNLIAAAEGNGIWLNTGGLTPSSNNVIQGNLIGTDITGTSVLGLLGSGIFIQKGSNNTVGGPAAGAGNVIAGSDFNGIRLDDGAFNNTIQGNLVGTDVSGTVLLGNAQTGIRFTNGSNRNTVGGAAAGAGNVIAGSGEAGIAVLDTSDRNALLGNSIFGNGGLGIDLANDGITPNDADDSDTGSNGLQNHPILTSAAATLTDVTIAGSLTSKPNRNYRVELFAGPFCDPSGSGEGERYLGFADVLTDGTGNASLNVVLAAGVGDGDAVTSTATETNGPTSEFSSCISASCASTVTLGQTILAQDRDTLVWTSPEDIRFVKGDLTAVSTYTANGGGTLLAGTSIDMAPDQPGPGDGSYYLVRPLACGSWQTLPGGEPARDTVLP